MGDRGHASVMALALLFGSVLLTGVAVDVARLLAEWQSVSHDAHTAAETGAGWVRSDELYRDRLVIDEGQAVTMARAVVTPGRSVGVTVSGSRVCVTVGSSVEPGIGRLVGATTREVAASACASPRQG